MIFSSFAQNKKAMRKIFPRLKTKKPWIEFQSIHGFNWLNLLFNGQPAPVGRLWPS